MELLVRKLMLLFTIKMELEQKKVTWLHYTGCNKVYLRITLWMSSDALESRIIQDLLKDLGFYKGKIDGDFGPNSEKALERAANHYDLSNDNRLIEKLAVIGDGSSSSVEITKKKVDPKIKATPPKGGSNQNASPSDDIYNVSSGSGFYISSSGP